MLVFGLGTLPLMVSMGFAIGTLTRALQGRILHNLAGITVMLFGLYTLVLAPPMHGHHGQPATDGSATSAPARHPHHGGMEALSP